MSFSNKLLNLNSFSFLVLIILVVPFLARAETSNIVITRQTADQFNQIEQARAWREQDEIKRREALAISIRDKSEEQAKLQSHRDEAARNAALLFGERQAEADRIARIVESKRRLNLAIEKARFASEVKKASEIQHEDALIDVRREARRHVRDAALADMKAGKIPRAEAARRMLYSTPEREAIVEQFSKGMITKADAFSLFVADDNANSAAADVKLVPKSTAK